MLTSDFPILFQEKTLPSSMNTDNIPQGREHVNCYIINLLAFSSLVAFEFIILHRAATTVPLKIRISINTQ